MKILIYVLFQVFLFSFIKSDSREDLKVLEETGAVNDDVVTEIDLPNFDVRERFRSCYNDGRSELYDEITVCYTNWPIQFSLIVTDKICIKKSGKNRILSSMNINSCMKLDGKVQNCVDLKNFYLTYEAALGTVNTTISYFNENGAQYYDENPYKLLLNDTTNVGYFTNCTEFNSSISSLKITVNKDYKILSESVSADFAEIKRLIFEEGPILALIDTNRKEIINIDNAIYFPGPIDEQNHDGYKFLRVIGWRTLNGKTYWIFSYTMNENWGLGNYKLIAQKDNNLTFINLQLD